MRYFLDAEFINERECFELVSLGVVSEDGRELYGVNTEARTEYASAFMRAHVLPSLLDTYHAERVVMGSPVQLAIALSWFINPYQRNQFWGYHGAYAWVLMTRLFRGHPTGWPRSCFELKQRWVELGYPALPAKPEGLHHALVNARWNACCYDILEKR